MTTRTVASAIIGAVIAASGASTVSANQGSSVIVKTKTVQQVITPKDPLVAAYVSASAPGLGQVYAGNWRRGLAFALGTGATLGTAAGIAISELNLDLADYDKAENGGNADGVIQTTEARDWHDKKANDEAFERMSGGKKAVMITAGIAGATLWIWNVVDAYRTAQTYNRVNFAADEGKGLKVGMGLGRNGKPAAQLAYGF